MPAPNPVKNLIRRELLDQAPFGSYQTRYEHFDQFYRLPKLAATVDDQKNIDWQLSGTNAADLDVTHDVDGGLNIVTAGADNDQVILSPLAASALVTTEWEPEHASRCEFVLELDALTTVLIHAGFGLTAALDLTTDADQAKFQFSSEGAESTANWTAAESVGGVDVETDTGRIAEVTKTIRLAVECNTLRSARFYVNGILKHTSAALTAGVNFIPFLGIQSLSAAADTILLRSVRVNRLLTDA